MGAAVALRQPNFDFGTFGLFSQMLPQVSPRPHTQPNVPSIQGSQSYVDHDPLSIGSQFSTRPSSPMSELQESERVPAKRRRTRNESSGDGGQSDHSMASSQPPLLLSWSVNSDTSGPSGGAQGAASSSSMAPTPSVASSKESNLYRLVVQQLFPSYHPDEMDTINLPTIGRGMLIYFVVDNY